MKKLLLAVLLMTALTGCLEKAVTHTLFIETDGSVTWTVVEDNVYSSSDTASERTSEEAEYLRRALDARPEIVEALESIGGTQVEVQLLRARRPFALRASAHFDALDQALRGWVDAGDLEAQIQLTVVAGRHELTIEPYPDASRSEAAEVAGELDEFARAESFRFVLAAGRFEPTAGFELADEGRIAIWSFEGPDGGGPAGEPRRLVWHFAPER